MVLRLGTLKEADQHAEAFDDFRLLRRRRWYVRRVVGGPGWLAGVRPT